jgi:GDPmannose 4,6-dehydratase
LELTFKEVGLSWQEYVEIDPRYLRPSEVDLLLGDASKTKQQLGWQPKTSFNELVRIMVESDWAIAKSEQSGVRRAAA